MERQREKEVVGSHDDVEGPGVARLLERPLGAMLSRGLSVAKRGGSCTPVCAWKLEEDVDEAGPSGASDRAETAAEAVRNGARLKRHRRHQISLPFSAAAAGGAGSAVTARKLGAGLWEMQDLPRYRRVRRSARARRRRDEKIANLPGFSPLGRHHEEVAAFSQAITPPCSLNLKGRPKYCRKISTEFLKVLNRIWSMQEQHTTTVSLVDVLKLELEHAQVRIQELLQEKQPNQEAINHLMKQLMDEKLTKKSMEQEKITPAVRSQRDELEGERRLKRHSEGLYQRLVKELSEMKTAFSKATEDLEREKKAHNLLEDLCDEFAKGIREYEQEVRELKEKSEGSGHNRCTSLILHLSEAWMLERLQIKLAESRGDLFEKNKIIDRLECEVGAFLQTRRSCNLNGDILIQKDSIKDRCLRRHSLESMHLSGAASAPQHAEDEDSAASDLHCFELNMSTGATGRHGHLKHNRLQCVEKSEAGNSDVRKKTLKTSERQFKHRGTSSS